jgi:hypothetical protein
MSNDISPTPASGGAVVEDGKKKGHVNHEEFGETEMDDLRKVGDEQRIEVTPEEVGFLLSRMYGTTLTRTG